MPLPIWFTVWNLNFSSLGGFSNLTLVITQVALPKMAKMSRNDSIGAGEGAGMGACSLTWTGKGWQQERAQPLQKPLWYCIKSLKTFISFHPIIALLGIHQRKIRDAHQNIIYNNEKLKTSMSHIGRLVK